MRIEHFQQNGNIKNIAHIDASNNELSSSMITETQKIPQSISISSSSSSQQLPTSTLMKISSEQVNDVKIFTTIEDMKSKIETQVITTTAPATTITTSTQTTPAKIVTSGETKTIETKMVKTSTKNENKVIDGKDAINGGNDNGGDNNKEGKENNEDEKKEVEEGYSLIKYPKGKSCFRQTTWIIIWPIHLLFFFTIPDCERKKLKKLFPLTFLMCIIWIGSLSYMVAWMITIIGM